MRHSREEVVERTIREFELLDQLVAGLSDEDWDRPLLRPEAKDPWTVKDALVHITYWKADVARFARGQRRPPEERGLRTMTTTTSSTSAGATALRRRFWPPGTGRSRRTC